MVELIIGDLTTFLAQVNTNETTNDTIISLVRYSNRKNNIFHVEFRLSFSSSFSIDYPI